ncbi:hypothetical protein GKR67_18765 [Providencia alcalifaciens]|uniref:Thoeris protein ThsB TIR-like domain-containing protein n=1 Tax=Providencia alcalifaciens TaxID=126385 RepID=A0AAW9VEW0_9GAMM|nr:hypothetical protein [Providencia alcalifaciens]
MHKTFISYHHDNEQDLKNEIIKKYGNESFIDKSVSDGDIDPDCDEEYIMKLIREDYLEDTTVTVVLIGKETSQRPFVNSEIQASLWGDNFNGLVGVIRDDIYSVIFGESVCNYSGCGCNQKLRSIISRGYNQLLPYLVRENHKKDDVVYHYDDTEIFCSLVKYSDFFKNPEYYINQAFDKRGSMEPARKRNSSDTPAIRKE